MLDLQTTFVDCMPNDMSLKYPFSQHYDMNQVHGCSRIQTE